VLGNSGPISIPPAAKITIGGDGTISIQPLGGNGASTVTVDRLKLVNPADNALYKDTTGLMRANDGQPFPADAAVRVQSGALESSNVNPAEALVGMIESARRFELQVKMMKVAEDNSSATNQLLRLE
jgi:flagellar basal-body rod protein FlgF